MSHINIKNDAEWHALRSRHVGASESAALFGMLPWMSQWQLWMTKSGKLDAPNLDAVKHVSAGKHFEPAVAAWAQQKWGITLRKVHRYMMADDCPGMGASLDFQQVGTGEYIDTEIKWVVRKDDAWEYEGDNIVQAPDYYVIQAQHQMGCSGSAKAQLLAFIDGDVRRAVYDRREGMIAAIKDRIREFWLSVEEGAEPMIDFKADAEAVMRYAAKMAHCQVDWTAELQAKVRRAYWLGEAHTAIGKKYDALVAEIDHQMIEEAKAKGVTDTEAKVILEGKIGERFHRVTSSFVSPYAGKEVVPDMVGSFIGARGAFRKVTISAPKPKKSKKEST